MSLITDMQGQIADLQRQVEALTERVEGHYHVCNDYSTSKPIPNHDTPPQPATGKYVHLHSADADPATDDGLLPCGCPKDGLRSGNCTSTSPAPRGDAERFPVGSRAYRVGTVTCNHGDSVRGVQGTRDICVEFDVGGQVWFRVDELSSTEQGLVFPRISSDADLVRVVADAIRRVPTGGWDMDSCARDVLSAIAKHLEGGVE